MQYFTQYFDVELLARIQFGFTIAFHITFPAFTIGLASWLTVIEAMWLKTRKNTYKEIYQFWVKIFAVTFGMGVVSGVVMSYQIGTNWSNYSLVVGNVLGPLFGYEVLTAFFLEASFLGIMLFGWGRVSEKAHFIATLVVAIGTLFSAFWIISANSWMQTPQGFYMQDGIAYPENWMKIIFNPSFPYRLVHMVTGAYLTTAFVIGGVGAWYLYHNRYVKHARVMLGMAMIMAVFVAPMQAFFGDMHGLNTLKHQPRKVAAIESIWETEKGASLKLFGIPDQKNETTHYTIEIPKLGSLILTHEMEGEIKGLKEWAKEDRPPVLPVFFSFRIMVSIGLLMILTGIVGAILYARGKLFTTRIFQLWCMGMTPMGFLAIICGWFVTEIGRQPYIVYGVLRTSDAISPVKPELVGISLIIFIIVYIAIFGTATYYILKLISKGPKIINSDELYGSHGMNNHPIISDVLTDEGSTEYADNKGIFEDNVRDKNFKGGNGLREKNKNGDRDV